MHCATSQRCVAPLRAVSVIFMSTEQLKPITALIKRIFIHAASYLILSITSSQNRQHRFIRTEDALRNLTLVGVAGCGMLELYI